MGRYEIIKSSDKFEDMGEAAAEEMPESLQDFLKRDLEENNILTQEHLHDKLVEYFKKFASDPNQIRLIINSYEENVSIDPGNEYTEEVMKEVDRVFKHNRA